MFPKKNPRFEERMVRGEWMRGFEAIPAREIKCQDKTPCGGSENMTVWHLVILRNYGNHHGFWSRGILNYLEHWAYFDGFKLSAPVPLPEDAPQPGKDYLVSDQQVPVRDGTKVGVRF